MNTVPSIAQAHAAKAMQSKAHQAVAKDVSEVVDADPLHKAHQYVEKLPLNELCETAKWLAAQEMLNQFSLGGVLLRIKHNAHTWKTAGFPSFYAFTEKQLGMKSASVGSYMRVYQALTSNGVPYDAVKSIRWSVLREVAAVLDAKTLTEQVARYSLLTVDEVKELPEIAATKNQVKAEAGNKGVAVKSANHAAKQSAKGDKTSTKHYEIPTVQPAGKTNGHVLPQDALSGSKAAKTYIKALGAGDALAMLVELFGEDELSAAACTQLDLMPQIVEPTIKPGTKVTKH